ncbi:MAG: hypothetical protein ABI728_02590 [Betaproteobacteria bacterium]
MVGEPNRIEADKLKAYAVIAKDAMAFARTGNLRQRRQVVVSILCIAAGCSAGPHPSLREMQARQDAQMQHWAE